MLNVRRASFSWSGSDDRAGALVFAYRLDGQVWSAFGPETSVPVDELSDGSHRFEVKARDVAGNEDASPAQHEFSVDATAPLPASGFTAQLTNGGVRVEWDPSPSPDVARYRLYWNGAVGAINYQMPITTISHPTRAFALTSLPAGGTYQFGLRAIDRAGNEETNAKPRRTHRARAASVRSPSGAT